MPKIITPDAKAQRTQRKWDKINCKKKTAYKTAEAAKIDVGFNVPLNPYRCSVCRQWHLTSKGA